MSIKAGAVALVAGLAAFFGVGIGVTAITAHWIEFSVFLGLLSGTVAGLAVTAGVSVALSGDVPDGRGRVAGAVAGFGVGFVVVLLVAASLEPFGTIGAAGIGFVGGLLAAVGAYRFAPTVGSRSDVESDPREPQDARE